MVCLEVVQPIVIICSNFFGRKELERARGMGKLAIAPDDVEICGRN
jgi:hypothetical protein